MHNSIDRRLTQLEEATAAPTVPYHQARERASDFYRRLYKIYGAAGNEVVSEAEIDAEIEEEVEAMAQHLVAGTYEQWASEQVRTIYARLDAEAAHAQP